MAAENGIPTAIVAAPGVMRRALLAFLRAVPGVEVVNVWDDCDAALVGLAQEQPAVVIVDADVQTQEALRLVQTLRAEHAGLACVALVSTLDQQRAFQAVGARYALLKGFLDEQLCRALLGAGRQRSGESCQSEQEEDARDD
jgi:DNA-binding NarL/FixJ family response regulator